MLHQEKRAVTVVTPSYTTAALCKKGQLNLVPTDSINHIDLAFDGCDQVDEHLNAIKSGGGIHTEEKIIAQMADDYVLLIDETKYFKQIPFDLPINLEVIPSAKEKIKKEIEQLNGIAKERFSQTSDGCTYTSHGNLFIETYWQNVSSLKQLNQQLLMLSGVVDTSLFYQIATKIIMVNEHSSQVIERKG